MPEGGRVLKDRTDNCGVKNYSEYRNKENDGRMFSLSPKPGNSTVGCTSPPMAAEDATRRLTEKNYHAWEKTEVRVWVLRSPQKIAQKKREKCAGNYYKICAVIQENCAKIVLRRKFGYLHSASPLYRALIGCSENRTASVRSLLDTCIPMRPFTLEVAELESNYRFNSCAASKLFTHWLTCFLSVGAGARYVLFQSRRPSGRRGPDVAVASARTRNTRSDTPATAAAATTI